MALGVDYVERVRLDLIFVKIDEVFILLRSAPRRFGLYYTENTAFDFFLYPGRYISKPVGRESFRATVRTWKN